MDIEGLKVFLDEHLIGRIVFGIICIIVGTIYGAFIINEGGFLQVFYEIYFAVAIIVIGAIFIFGEYGIMVFPLLKLFF